MSERYIAFRVPRFFTEFTCGLYDGDDRWYLESNGRFDMRLMLRLPEIDKNEYWEITNVDTAEHTVQLDLRTAE